ncbi:fatty acid synthase alpha subunit Lsd1, partial [Coemansia aciculifera]
DWSVAFGRAPMPFDGILLGSRVMVALEAGTSLAAKELIVAAPGLSDSEWQNSYDGPSGGVVTITSNYGELNHVLATKAVLFFNDLRYTILNQPRENHAALLLARKNEIVTRLNSDYFKPWFGRKADGRVADLEDMTYAEVISRLIELMYVKHQQRWIHKSYCRLVFDFVGRSERRLGTDLLELSIILELQNVDPTGLVQSFVERYPAAESQLLHSEDIQFFISICKRRGQKPVPFIPVLDIDFSVLLSKDSLWQSEDLDSVVDHDPQRIAIQQGPVAARYSTVVNEPVKDILDGVYHGHIAALLSRDYNGDAASVPVVEYVGAQPQAMAALPATVDMQVTDSALTYQLPAESDQLPELSEWLSILAGPTNSWLRALLTTPAIVEGTGYVHNYVQRVLRPRPGQVVTVSMDGCQPRLLEVVDVEGVLRARVERNSDGVIELIIYHPVASGTISLCYLFVYQPQQPLTPICLLTEGHSTRVRKLCMDAWLDNADVPAAATTVLNVNCRLDSDGFAITEEHVRAFCQNVGNRSKHYAVEVDGELFAPMDFFMVSALPNMLLALSAPVVTDDWLKVLHLYNKYQIVDGATMLKVGDKVRSELVIANLVNTPIGRKVTLFINLSCCGRKVATIESTFMYRDHFLDIDKTFERALDRRFTIQLATAVDVTVLEAKEWFVYCEDASIRVSPGSVIEFHLDSYYRFKSESVYSNVSTNGRVFVKSASGQLVHIGDVCYAYGISAKDPVIEYLRRHETTTDSRVFDHGGHMLTSLDEPQRPYTRVPKSNWEYGRVSSDGNPMHVNLYIADHAGLPGPITHGLWTNASTRALVECYAADDEPERIRMYQSNFVGMVLPKDQLQTELFH